MSVSHTHFQLFMKVLPVFPNDLILLVMQFLFDHPYEKVEMEVENSICMHITNDLLCTTLYILRDHMLSRRSNSNSKNISEFISFYNDEKETWSIGRGHVFACFTYNEDDYITIYSFPKEEKKTLIPSHVIRLKNILFDLHFHSADIDNHYLYVGARTNIFLLSLDQSKKWYHFPPSLANESQRYHVVVDHKGNQFYIHVYWFKKQGRIKKNEIWIYEKTNTQLDHPNQIWRCKTKKMVRNLHVFNNYLYMIYSHQIEIYPLPFHNHTKQVQTIQMGVDMLRCISQKDTFIQFTGDAAFVHNKLYVIVRNHKLDLNFLYKFT